MFTNRFSKITVAIIVVTIALVTANMIPAGSASPNSKAAHVEYLNGEKATYAGAVNSSNALSAWRLGEKSIVNVVQSKEQALREYRLGERYGEAPQLIAPFSPEQIRRELILGERFGEIPAHIVPSITAPKPAFILATGNQNVYVEFLRGEKANVRSDALEAALSAWHQGEKELE